MATLPYMDMRKLAEEQEQLLREQGVPPPTLLDLLTQGTYAKLGFTNTL